jgi:Family of unknown function (DUF6998)
MNGIDELPRLIQRLYGIGDRLQELFPGRRFTPDGHLVGSIGVVLAAHDYGVVPLPESTRVHDAAAPDGRLVQIKLTQTGVVGLRSEPEHLLVLQLERGGRASEVFNGPGALAWERAGPVQSNGQRPISLSRLRNLMNEVPTEARLVRHNA